MALAMTTMLAAPAFAAGVVQHDYVGADVGTQHLNGEATDSAGLHVGTFVNKNLALELGFAQTQAAKSGNVSAKDFTTSLDAVGILPVADKTDLLGTVGIENQAVTASNLCGKNLNDDKFGPTIGAGAQYHFTDAVSVRGLVKYEDVSLPTVGQDHDVKSTVGLNVAF